MGSAQEEGDSKGRRLGAGVQQAPWCPSGQGKCWLRSLPFLHPLPLQSLLHCLWTSNCRWVPPGVGTPPLPQPPLRGAGPRGPAFTFAPPSLPLTPSGPAWLEGDSVCRGSGLGSQQVPGGPSGPAKRWPCSLLVLCPPNGPPHFPSRHGIPFTPPAAPQGRRSSPASTSPLPSLLPTSYPVSGGSSVPLGVRGPPPVPGRCPSCAETRMPHPPSPPS